MGTWSKAGLIYAPDTRKAWSRSHASAPSALLLPNGMARVYFASRDADNRSHVGWFETDLARPGAIVAVADEPVLAPGPLGSYDDHGIYASSVVRHGDEVWLYTIGWNPGVRRPLFYSTIGLAISADGGRSFRKYGRGPIIARSDHDPLLVTAPCVLADGSGWHMWYVSGVAWHEDAGGALYSVYNLRYAHSDDGVKWTTTGRTCIDVDASRGERNIGRAHVSRSRLGGYEAWFSSNGGQYRISYATSPDGLNWTRGETPPELQEPSGPWESDAMAHPSIIDHDGKRYMFYNGNAFGRDGVGLAIFSED